jgi:hypothetical protein
MDGVIADWHTATLKLWGISMDNLTLTGKLEYAIHKWISHELKIDLSYEELWSRINEATRNDNFWSDIQPYYHSFELVTRLSVLMQAYEGQLVVSSIPNGCHYAWGQKVLWLRSFFPELQEHFMLGKDKHLLAKPNHILIDDCDENIDKFREHGGKAIVFPQRWNRKYQEVNADFKIEAVMFEVETYIDQIENGA